MEGRGKKWEIVGNMKGGCHFIWLLEKERGRIMMVTLAQLCYNKQYIGYHIVVRETHQAVA